MELRVRCLLDSHALIWFMIDDPRLAIRAAAVLDDNANDVFVSAASAWEVCTKHRLGKLPEAADLARDFQMTVLRNGFGLLDITTGHASLAGSMAGSHKDPFDRMLIAQALSENLVLVSNEAAFDAFGVSRLW